VTLVNKDQLEILASLRDSVNEDKVGLEADVDRLQKQIKELSEKNRMQLEQINGLLLEKVNLQTEGIGHREKLLQRERDLGYGLALIPGRGLINLRCSDLRAVLAGRDLPEDVKQRLLAMHEENIALKESVKTVQEKYVKARQFIKNQDKLFKEQYSSGSANFPVRRSKYSIFTVSHAFARLGHLKRRKPASDPKSRCSRKILLDRR
jgi:protein HOOK3